MKCEQVKLKKLVYGALFAALTCVATMVVRIPTPTGGYVNPGDAIVLLGAFLLGPYWGALAAGIGSAMADIISGYVIYAPGTIVIKACMALVAGFMLKRIGKTHPALATIFAGITAAVIMVVGYFGYTAVFLGYGLGALADVPGNCIQGVFGFGAGSALFVSLSKIPHIKDLMK